MRIHGYDWIIKLYSMIFAAYSCVFTLNIIQIPETFVIIHWVYMHIDVYREDKRWARIQTVSTSKYNRIQANAHEYKWIWAVSTSQYKRTQANKQPNTGECKRWAQAITSECNRISANARNTNGFQLNTIEYNPQCKRIQVNTSEYRWCVQAETSEHRRIQRI